MWANGYAAENMVSFHNVDDDQATVRAADISLSDILPSQENYDDLREVIENENKRILYLSSMRLIFCTNLSFNHTLCFL